MLLNEVRLTNFMPYKGQQLLRLPTTPERNVVVIYGDNMRGKTSLLNAVRWCLFGKALGRHLRPIPNVNLFNSEAAREGMWRTSVDLLFEHGGRSYQITRSIERRELVDKPTVDEHVVMKTSLLIDGEAVRADLIADEIDQVMPEDISRFYLFDGELLQEYEQLLQDRSEQADRIREEIEKVLGVPALLHAREDLAVLLQKFNRQLAQQGKLNRNLSAQAEQLQIWQERRSLLAADLKRQKQSEASMVREIEDLADQLERTSRAEAVKQQIESATRQCSALKADIDALLDERQSLVPSLWLDLIAPLASARTAELRNRRADAIDTIERNAAIRSELSRIQNTLSDFVCRTCGQSLPASQRRALEEQRDSLAATVARMDPSSTNLGEIEGAISALETLRGSGARSELDRIERRLRKLEVDLIRQENIKTELEDQVDESAVEQVRANRERHTLLNRELGFIRGSIQDLHSKLDELDGKIKAMSKSMTAVATGGVAKVGLRVRTTQELHDVVQASVEILRDRLRLLVQDRSSAAFREMISDKSYRGLQINDRYGLQIVDETGSVVAERAAGAEQIVALSLIDGLNRVSGKAGPIIMDTPFGRLDLRHRENVLRHLPGMAEQVMLLVHEGELDRSRDLRHIGDHIAATYEIRHVTSSHTQLIRA